MYEMKSGALKGVQYQNGTEVAMNQTTTMLGVDHVLSDEPDATYFRENFSTYAQFAIDYINSPLQNTHLGQQGTVAFGEDIELLWKIYLRLVTPGLTCCIDPKAVGLNYPAAVADTRGALEIKMLKEISGSDDISPGVAKYMKDHYGCSANALEVTEPNVYAIPVSEKDGDESDHDSDVEPDEDLRETFAQYVARLNKDPLKRQAVIESMKADHQTFVDIDDTQSIALDAIDLDMEIETLDGDDDADDLSTDSDSSDFSDDSEMLRGSVAHSVVDDAMHEGRESVLDNLMEAEGGTAASAGTAHADAARERRVSRRRERKQLKKLRRKKRRILKKQRKIERRALFKSWRLEMMARRNRYNRWKARQERLAERKKARAHHMAHDESEIFVHYVNAPATATIQQASFRVNNMECDIFTRLSLFVYGELSVGASKRDGYNAMVGKYDTREELILASKRRAIYYQIIPFFFCRYITQILGVVCGLYSTPELTLMLAPLDQLIVRSHANVAVLNASTNTALKESDVDVSVDMVKIVMQEDERERFQNMPYDVIVTLHGQDSVQTKNSDSALVTYKCGHNITAVHWVVQRMAALEQNDHFSTAGLLGEHPIAHAEVRAGMSVRCMSREPEFWQLQTHMNHEVTVPTSSYIYSSYFCLQSKVSTPNGGNQFGRYGGLGVFVQLQPGLENELVRVSIFVEFMMLFKYEGGAMGTMFART